MLFWSIITTAVVATLCHGTSAEKKPSYWYSDSANASLIAFTSNGPILGHLAANVTSVVEYLGIRYAEPVVGELRFAPAQPYTTRGFQDASTFGYDCPAPVSPPSTYPNLTPQAQRIINYFTGSYNQDEDCLTLNVWQPRRSARSSLLPVLVHFYGGRFTTGTTDTPFNYGQTLADSQKIVVVTTNFRENIFGFPGIPGQTQNLGIRDQRLAVEWVQRNARAFGGDSAKIVISGQSAGAVAVDYWSYAYPKEPIVRGLISHSGTALSFPIIAADVVASNWYNVSAQLGCGSSGDVLACMRTKPWQAIQAAANKLPSAPGGSPLRSTTPFYPVADNEVVFADYKSLSDDGAFAKIPYLLGNNENEQGYYALIAYAKGINATKAQGDAFLLSSFTCPNYYEANNRRKHDVPVWLFQYFGDWDNLRLYPGSGAYHGADVEMILGNDELVSGIPPSAAEIRTTALMQAVWGAYIRDPAAGLPRLGYPSFNADADTLIRFAYDNQPDATFVSPNMYAGACINITLAGAV